MIPTGARVRFRQPVPTTLDDHAVTVPRGAQGEVSERSDYRPRTPAWGTPLVAIRLDHDTWTGPWCQFSSRTVRVSEGDLEIIPTPAGT